MKKYKKGKPNTNAGTNKTFETGHVGALKFDNIITLTGWESL